VVRGGWGQGGEMTQALYAHMNNTIIKKKKNFLVGSLGPFKCRIISSNKDNLTSSFPIWIPFIPLSCIFVWLRIQALCWIVWRDLHFCLISYFRENSFTLSSFRIMLAIGLLYYYIEGLYYHS
jgi:hypothetical protein